MKSVLIVDDEEALVLAIELVLCDEYRILKAASGEEALALVKDCHPDLILLDIMMPGLGGLQTLKMLKLHPDYQNIPVVLMSGARPLVRRIDHGWVYFLNKPFSTEQLRSAIQTYV